MSRWRRFKSAVLCMLTCRGYATVTVNEWRAGSWYHETLCSRCGHVWHSCRAGRGVHCAVLAAVLLCGSQARANEPVQHHNPAVIRVWSMDGCRTCYRVKEAAQQAGSTPVVHAVLPSATTPKAFPLVEYSDHVCDNGGRVVLGLARWNATYILNEVKF